MYVHDKRFCGLSLLDLIDGFQLDILETNQESSQKQINHNRK